MKILKYNVEIYPFRRIVEQLLETDRLEELALRRQETVFKRENDQSTPWHKAFYARFIGSALDYEYMRFLKREILTKYNELCLYQRIPTFRVQLQDNVAVGEWHRDTDYGHDEAEMNYWLPFTKAFDTNTVWIEGEPQKLEYGEVLEFEGSRLHGNKINKTGQTRVSMDFRVLPKSKFRENDKVTVNSKLAFKIGGYWGVFVD